jgi:hypothetical protein
LDSITSCADAHPPLTTQITPAPLGFCFAPSAGVNTSIVSATPGSRP